LIIGCRIPKNRRSKRWLEERAPKVHENVKRALLIRGGRTNETVMKALKDLNAIKKPDSVMMQKKNILRPFEDQTSLVTICTIQILQVIIPMLLVGSGIL
jgi:hypothetical protein